MLENLCLSTVDSISKIATICNLNRKPSIQFTSQNWHLFYKPFNVNTIPAKYALFLTPDAMVLGDVVFKKRRRPEPTGVMLQDGTKLNFDGHLGLVKEVHFNDGTTWDATLGWTR